MFKYIPLSLQIELIGKGARRALRFLTSYKKYEENPKESQISNTVIDRKNQTF